MVEEAKAHLKLCITKKTDFERDVIYDLIAEESSEALDSVKAFVNAIEVGENNVSQTLIIDRITDPTSPSSSSRYFATDTHAGITRSEDLYNFILTTFWTCRNCGAGANFREKDGFCRMRKCREGRATGVSWRTLLANKRRGSADHNGRSSSKKDDSISVSDFVNSNTGKRNSANKSDIIMVNGDSTKKDSNRKSKSPSRSRSPRTQKFVKIS